MKSFSTNLFFKDSALVRGIMAIFFCAAPFSASAVEAIVYSRHMALTLGREIRIVNIDGTNDHAVTRGSWPRLSPDGRYLAFFRDGGYPPSSATPYNHLYVRDMRTTTGAETRLFINNRQMVGYSWLANSTQLLFDHHCTIYRRNFDGSNQITVIAAHCNDDAPAVSVASGDGRIAFHNYTVGLRLANADGSGVVTIPNTQPGDYWPAWSPDGQWISFTRGGASSNLGRNYYKIRPDGTQLRQLTFLPNNDWNSLSAAGPWTADGKRLIAPGVVNGESDIYAIATDGDGGITPINAQYGCEADFVGSIFEYNQADAKWLSISE